MAICFILCVFSRLSASWALKKLQCEKGSNPRMKEHPLWLKRLETRGPTTPAASAGAAVAAAPGRWRCRYHGLQSMRAGP